MAMATTNFVVVSFLENAATAGTNREMNISGIYYVVHVLLICMHAYMGMCREFSLSLLACKFIRWKIVTGRIR